MKINVTINFGCSAVKIEQIVTSHINVKIDFGPNAAEMEQIVTLILMVTICSISAALHPKSIVTLIFITIFAMFVQQCAKTQDEVSVWSYDLVYCCSCTKNN